MALVYEVYKAMEEEQDIQDEWTRHQIILPEDEEPDEDDELDAFLANLEKKRKAQIIRGNFRGTWWKS